MRKSGAQTRVVLWVLIFVACVSSIFPTFNAYAAAITARSLTLEANATAVSNGKATASAYSVAGHAGANQYIGFANHHFKFTAPTTSGIRSVGFQYCTTASGTCTAPTDLTAAGATLGATANLGSSPALTASTSTAYVSFGSDPTNSGTDLEITLTGVYNPSAINTTFYIRIFTYTTGSPTVGSTSPTDSGTVAASTARPIVLTGTMPEYLLFCTASNIGTATQGAFQVPDCTTATNGAVAFNQLFDPLSTATATSQMAAASNAGSGYSITYYADTLKSGSNSITPIGASATASTPNSRQFGLNVVANTTPSVGLAVSNPGVTGNTYNGQAIAPYATANQFAFVANTATAVANSNSQVSDSQIYTVSYIANVNGSQPAGLYTTTLTYVCTPTY